MMGMNFIRDFMRADIDPTPPSLPEPKKFTFISRLISPITDWNCREVYYSGDESGWTPINDRRKESDKDMATTHYDRVKPNWLNITKVVFNDPATIVFWGDGTKTVVKCSENETFDHEKGLVMAIAKKAFGNQGRYYNQIKKWLPEEEKRPTVSVDGNAILGALKSKLEAAGATLDVRRTDETE